MALSISTEYNTPEAPLANGRRYRHRQPQLEPRLLIISVCIVLNRSQVGVLHVDRVSDEVQHLLAA
jgi:hypothetical protein